jgi:hypothetical protein
MYREDCIVIQSMAYRFVHQGNCRNRQSLFFSSEHLGARILPLNSAASLTGRTKNYIASGVVESRVESEIFSLSSCSVKIPKRGEIFLSSDEPLNHYCLAWCTVIRHINKYLTNVYVTASFERTQVVCYTRFFTFVLTFARFAYVIIPQMLFREQLVYVTAPTAKTGVVTL